MQLLLILVCAAILSSGARTPFTKNEIQSSSAVCVDGSPAVYYSAINEGDPTAPWLIWLDGPNNPIYVSDLQFPRTTSWPTTAVFTYGPFADTQGTFASYSMAVLMYCSNDFFVGNSSVPSPDGQTVVQYRGYVIMEKFLREIQPQLSQASQLVIGGATSGALGVVSNFKLFNDILGSPLMDSAKLLLDSPFFTPTVSPTMGLLAITQSSPSRTCSLNETHVVYADSPNEVIPCCLDYLCASSLLPSTTKVMLLQSLSYATGVNDALLVSTQQTGAYSASQVYNLSLATTWNGALVSTALRQAANERTQSTAYIGFSCIASPILSPFGNSRCLRANYKDRTVQYTGVNNLTITADLGCADAAQSFDLSMGDYRSNWINTPDLWSQMSVSYFPTDIGQAAIDRSIEDLVGLWMKGYTVRAEETCQGMNCNPSCGATTIFLGVTPYVHISSLAGIFLLCTLGMAIAGFAIAYCRPKKPLIGNENNNGENFSSLNRSAHSQAIANSRTMEAKGLTYWNSGSMAAPSLKSVSFTIPQGSLVGIIGGSGCGKSTLLELLAGRRDAGAWCGEIRVCGKAVTTEWLARNTGIVRQSLSPLVDQLTLSQNLEYAAMLRVRGSAEFIRERIAFVLERLELAEFKNSITSTLSGGQRKRAEVALELLTQPDILFLDEPTSALDARTALNFMDWIAKVARNTGSSIILSIHQPREEIWSLFSQIILLEKGFLVYSGPPFELTATGSNNVSLVNPADLAVELAGNRRAEMIAASDDWCSNTIESLDEELLASDLTTKARCWLFPKKAKKQVSLRNSLTVSQKKLAAGSRKTSLVPQTHQDDEEKIKLFSSTPSMACQVRSFLLRMMAVHPPFKITMRSVVGLSLLSVIVALLLAMVFWSMDSDSVRTKALAFLVLVPAFLSNSFVVSYVCEDIAIYFIERSNYYVTPIGFFVHHILHLAIYIIIPFTVFPLMQYFLLWGRVLNEFSYPMFVQMVGFSQICFVAFLSLFVFSCFLLKGKTSNAMIMNSSLESLFALFSGFLAPLPSLTLEPILWLSYVSPALWGYVGVAYSIANRQFPGDCGPSTTATETTCFLSQSGNAMIYELGFQNLDPFIAWIILVGWSVMFFFLSWLVLARPWHKGPIKLVPVPCQGATDAFEALGNIATAEQEIFLKAVQQYNTGELASPRRNKTVASTRSQDVTDEEECETPPIEAL
jgi:ABC-type multidrug transport system ATPase subunit